MCRRPTHMRLGNRLAPGTRTADAAPRRDHRDRLDGGAGPLDSRHRNAKVTARRVVRVTLCVRTRPHPCGRVGPRCVLSRSSGGCACHGRAAGIGCRCWHGWVVLGGSAAAGRRRCRRLRARWRPVGAAAGIPAPGAWSRADSRSHRDRRSEQWCSLLGSPIAAAARAGMAWGVRAARRRSRYSQPSARAGRSASASSVVRLTSPRRFLLTPTGPRVRPPHASSAQLMAMGIPASIAPVSARFPPPRSGRSPPPAPPRAPGPRPGHRPRWRCRSAPPGRAVPAGCRAAASGSRANWVRRTAAGSWMVMAPCLLALRLPRSTR